MPQAAVERKIQRHFDYTDLGVEAIEAGLRLYFGEDVKDLSFHIDGRGFHIIAADCLTASDWTWASVGSETIQFVASAVQTWLDRLTSEERFAIHRSTPMDGFRGRDDDGFRMMSNHIFNRHHVVLTIQPAWV